MAQITQLSAIAVPGRRYGLVIREIQTLTLVLSTPSILIGQAFPVDTLILVAASQVLVIVTIPSPIVMFDLNVNRQASFDLDLNRQASFDLDLNRQPSFNLDLDQQASFDLDLSRQVSFDLNINMMEVD